VAAAKVWLQSFLTSALDGGKLSVSRSGKFDPGGKRHLYVLNGTLGRPPRDYLDCSEANKYKIIKPTWAVQIRHIVIAKYRCYVSSYFLFVR